VTEMRDTGCTDGRDGFRYSPPITIDLGTSHYLVYVTVYHSGFMCASFAELSLLHVGAIFNRFLGRVV
jgi:hypothetical protein